MQYVYKITLLLVFSLMSPSSSTAFQKLNKEGMALSNIKVFNNLAEFASIGYDNCSMVSNGELAIIKSFICGGDLVLDVGANKGEWSQYVLASKASITLHAFEPIPAVYRKLKRNLKQQYPAMCHNIAVSDKNSLKDFYCYDTTTSASEVSSLFHRPILDTLLHTQPTIITVETKTLDLFCKEQLIEHIDFLKIDTEGSELNVLKGATDLLKNGSIKYIQFEYGGTYQDAHITLKEVHELLTTYGYLIFRIIPQGLVDITEWTPSLENYCYSNYLAVYNC